MENLQELTMEECNQIEGGLTIMQGAIVFGSAGAAIGLAAGGFLGAAVGGVLGAAAGAGIGYLSGDAP